jgi:hypothetical protein
MADQGSAGSDRPSSTGMVDDDQAADQAEYTGRYIVVFRQDAVQEGVKVLEDSTGLATANSMDFGGGPATAEAMGGPGTLVYENLGIAVVDSDPDQASAMRVASDASDATMAMEPERYVYALESGPGTEYVRGYRDGVASLAEQLLGGRPAQDMETRAQEALADETEATWGIQAIRALQSRCTGRGVKVAVLDTGFDLQHPDFKGRNIQSQSFVPGEDVQDLHGHGTHCIGTSCGSLQVGSVARYGVAYEADIYAGKVLSNSGSGADGWILAGIAWALTNGCQIISMSLGGPTRPGEAFSEVYENVALRVIAAGGLIIAAAGNESRRGMGRVRPVGRPANCPSVLAVGAVSSSFQIGDFSNQGSVRDGAVDLAGPGVDVFSTWRMPLRYRSISGTSMATPHVAGTAALIVQSNPNTVGLALWKALTASARVLPLAAADVGAGLVQAPDCV